MYELDLRTGQTGTRIPAADRTAVDGLLEQVKAGDGFISINPGGADAGRTEAYVPVRSITTVIVTRRP